MSQTSSVSKLSPYVGVEVHGRVQDFCNPDGKAFLYDLFLDRHLLLFRGQDLTGDEQVKFAEMFGPVSRRGDHMEQSKTAFSHISNTRADGILSDGELYFHADHCFYEHPLKAICLYAIEVPAQGGDTVFSDAGEAVARLPKALREKAGQLTGLHLYDYAGDYNHRMLEENTSSKAPRHEHPVIWPHPETRKPILFVNQISTARINGLSREEGDALLKELGGYIENPELIYEHKWTPGDLLIWDNRALQHARKDFDRSQKRTIRRVPLAESLTSSQH